jgi:hypothetical protein
VVAGVSLLLGAGGGLYWLVPGVAFSLVVAIVNAWVLLVEVVPWVLGLTIRFGT